MQAALQAHVDSAISKTINCPEAISFEAFKASLSRGLRLGLKGCTTYRPNPVTGAVLLASPDGRAPLTAHALPADTPAAAVRAPRAIAGEAATGAGGRQARRRRLHGEAAGARAALAGFTYKIKWPGSDHALYVTINDIERDGRRRPFEIFINTQNLEHYAWTVALTRMISAVFRRGGDVSFVVEELKACSIRRAGTGWRAATCRACWRPSARSSRRT